MKPIFAYPMRGFAALARIAELDIGLGAAVGAVAGGLIAGTAGNTLIGVFIGAGLFAFAMRPRFSWHMSSV